MNQHRVRIFLSESYFNDIVVPAETWFAAQLLGMGMSPVGKAIYLGEA